jgi:hypothetical protein
MSSRLERFLGYYSVEDTLILRIKSLRLLTNRVGESRSLTLPIILLLSIIIRL